MNLARGALQKVPCKRCLAKGALQKVHWKTTLAKGALQKILAKGSLQKVTGNNCFAEGALEKEPWKKSLAKGALQKVPCKSCLAKGCLTIRFFVVKLQLQNFELIYFEFKEADLMKPAELLILTATLHLTFTIPSH
jgi:hypothetical protein